MYFCPEDNSILSLYHFGLSSGVPDTEHSKTAASPAVTLTDPVLSKMAAGSENSKQPSNHRKYTLRRMLKGDKYKNSTNLEQLCLLCIVPHQHHF